MSKSGFRPCAARVSDKIRKILSSNFAVIMPFSAEAVFDSTSAFLVLGKGFQYVLLKFAGRVGGSSISAIYYIYLLFRLRRLLCLVPDSIYSHFVCVHVQNAPFSSLFCSSVKTGGEVVALLRRARRRLFSFLSVFFCILV